MVKVHLFLLFSLFHLLVIAQIPVEEKKSTSFMYYFLKGEEEFEKRNYQEALINYNESLILYPYHAESYFSRASTRDKLGNLQGALVDYNIYLELKPDQFDALFNRAVILFNQEKWDLAKRDFTKLLELSGSDEIRETQSVYFKQDLLTSSTAEIVTTGQSDRAYLFNYLGLCEFEMKDFTTALHYFDSAIANNPNEANYFVNSGKCFEQLNDFTQSIKAYETALLLNPDHIIAIQNLSQVKRKSGDANETLRLLDYAISKDSTLHFAWAERGYYYLTQEYYRKALFDYSQAIKLQPDDADYWLIRGNINEKLDQLTAAYHDYTQAVLLDETLEKAWLARANLLYNLQRYSEAIADYDVALVNATNYPIALYNRGLAKYQIGKFSSACEDIKQAAQNGFTVPANVTQKICNNQQ